MTLAVYPLVYLPVAASLRGADPWPEEIARSLGAGPAPHLRPDHAGPGRRAPSSAAACSSRWSCSPSTAPSRCSATRPSPPRSSPSSASPSASPAASALSLVLVVLSLFVLIGEGLVRGTGPGGPFRADGRTGRAGRTGSAGPAAGAGRASCCCRAWPSACRSAAIVYWIVRAAPHACRPECRCWTPPATPRSTAARPPRSPRPWRSRSRCSRSATQRADAALERSTYLVLAMPGLVVAFALVLLHRALRERVRSTRAHRCWFSAMRSCSSRWRWSGVRASVAQASAAGWRRWPGRSASVDLPCSRRVTLPLMAPGSGRCVLPGLSFRGYRADRDAVLIPTNAQTLATQFWAYQQNLSYGQAAPFAVGDDRDRRGAQLRAWRAFSIAPDMRTDEGCVNWRSLACTRLSAPIRADRAGPGGAGGLADGHPRPVRERQDDPAAAAGRLRARRRGTDRASATVGRRTGTPCPARATPHRLRPAGRQSLPASHRGRERRLRPARQQRRAGRAASCWRRSASAACEALPARAVRRPAAACRAGQALAIEPAVVLFDEPFSSLDAQLRASVRHDVQRIFRRPGPPRSS